MKIHYLLSLILLVLASACSSTGKGKYPPAFYSYTPEEQTLIRKGKIAVGFDEYQVRMALGKPSRILDNSSSRTYKWEYRYQEANTGVIQSIGRNIANGTITSGTVQRRPFVERVRTTVNFDRETRKVSSFRDR